VQYITYNTGNRALPDISALALGHCAPLGIMRIYQAKHSCPCYNYYIYLSEKEVDERLCALFELEEPDLIYELRAENSGRPSHRFEIFWQKAKEFLEEDVGTAVDDR